MAVSPAQIGAILANMAGLFAQTPQQASAAQSSLKTAQSVIVAEEQKRLQEEQEEARKSKAFGDLGATLLGVPGGIIGRSLGGGDPFDASAIAGDVGTNVKMAASFLGGGPAAALATGIGTAASGLTGPAASNAGNIPAAFGQAAGGQIGQAIARNLGQRGQQRSQTPIQDPIASRSTTQNSGLRFNLSNAPLQNDTGFRLEDTLSLGVRGIR